MTGTDIQNYDESKQCWIFENPFYDDDDKNIKVRVHCHISGRYRRAAHSYCNLQLSVKPCKTTIPTIFHNLRGYDYHLIMQATGKTKGKLSCIGTTVMYR